MAADERSPLSTGETLDFDDTIIEALNRFAANSKALIFVVNEDLCIEYISSSALQFMRTEVEDVKGRSYGFRTCRLP